MAPITKIAIGLSGVAGTAGIGVGGIYFSSREDIFSKVKDEVLGTEKEFDASWKAQFKKLSSESGKIPEDLKKLQSITVEKEQIEGIRNWCSSSYRVTYKSSFSEKREDLLNVVKKYCIQNLQEKLADLISGTSGSKVLSTSDNTDESEFKNNYKKLKDHNSSSDKLDSTFIHFSSTTAENDANTKWGELRDWCKTALTKSFKGESSDIFKTTKKFCIKHT